ncbi:MAG: hypothetical protein JNM18_05800 [Planctomycetaceae bacterium]|nr:hypothetical protein [Planctomycetaceae bacterium]
MGRKPLLDDIKRAQVCAILATGGTRSVAANYVGCTAETIRRTAERDPEFREALNRAESQHEIQYLQRIQEATKKDTHWRAAAWVLERTYPDRYATRKPRVLTIAELTETLDRFAELVAEHVPDLAARQKLLESLTALSTVFKTESSMSVAPAAATKPDSAGG